MESFDSGEKQRSLLLSELSLTKQLLIQLESQLTQVPSNSSPQLSKPIISRLLSQTENSLLLAKSCRLCSCAASPASGLSESPFRAQDDIDGNNNNDSNKREVSKKRKTLPRWRSQVRVGSTGGVEAPLDDGHSWRKYGQKDILGAKYPRAYYRCTYRTSQGCSATKQVQRSDENPSVFDIIYQGTHTCITAKSNAHHGSSDPVSSTNKNNNNASIAPARSSHDQAAYLNSLKASLTVNTQGLGPSDSEPNSISFSFTPTPATATATVDHNYFVGGGFLPSFANSPATSESNYFSVSPCAASGFGFRTADNYSDLTEVGSALSAATSTTNSPMAAVDHVFDGLDFDTNFQIDPCSFFA